jgi:ssDNA-binding Zn-finger/Zn-ribbon topoisomerase 1
VSRKSHGRYRRTKQPMLTHKQCPKCHGNIYLSADYYGRYEQCLQCGYTNDLDAIEEHSKKVVSRKEKAVTV